MCRVIEGAREMSSIEDALEAAMLAVVPAPKLLWQIVEAAINGAVKSGHLIPRDQLEQVGRRSPLGRLLDSECRVADCSDCVPVYRLTKGKS
jgi:hypothetical protein